MDTGPMVLSTAILGNDSIFFAGTTSGLFATNTLNGTNTAWQRVSPRVLKNHLIMDMEVDKIGRLTVGTHGGGAYRATYDVSNVPAGFSGSLPNLDIPINTSHDLDLSGHIAGDVSRIEVINSNSSVVNPVVSNNVITINALGTAGNCVLTVVLHASEDGHGAVESFAINTYDPTQQGQLTIEFNPTEITNQSVTGTLRINNTGQQDLNILSWSASNNIFLYVPLPIELDRGSSYVFVGRPLKANFNEVALGDTRILFHTDKYPYTHSFTLESLPLLNLSFAQNAYAVSEGGEMDVEITLSGTPSSDVVVPIISTPNNGATTSDYSIDASSITFMAGTTTLTQTVRVSTIENTIDDDDQSITLTFGELNGAIEGTHYFTTLTIQDNDDGDVTGLGDEEFQSLSLHPNPTGDVFYLKGINNYDLLEIYGMDGQLVHSRKKGLRISLKRLPAGIYIVKVRTRTDMYNTRIIKE